MSPQDLWDRAKADIQTSVSPSIYSMWIGSAQPLEIKEVSEDRIILVLGYQTIFHKSTAETRYYGQMKEALDRISGKKCEIQFVVGGTSQSKQQNTNPASNQEPLTISPLFSSSITQANNETDFFHRVLQKAHLKEEYTFETFAVSSSNEMAHAAAIAVSQNPGTAYNPLFLYGGVGVGKTHLMQAIGNNVLRRNPNTVLYYTTGEQFTNDIVAAIQQKKTIQLKERFRNYQVLLIDDIQFIAGKTTVQEEFFHTFNAILPVGGQIIITSDRPPHEINPLEDRLKSRFEAGLIVDIQQPSFELRTAILLIKAKKISLNIPMDIAQLIASTVESTRRLEGVLAQLHSQYTLMHKPLTTELVKTILGSSQDQVQQIQKPIKPSEILRVVCSHFHVNPALLKGAKRSQHLVLPRHIALYILMHDAKTSLVEAGEFMGGRDHTTVMHAIGKIENEIETDENIRTHITAIRTSLAS